MATTTAPSGAHQQPWTFVLVGDTEVRRQIREAAEEEEEEEEEEERVSYAGRLGAEWLDALKPLGTDPVKAHLTEAPHLTVDEPHAA